MIHSVKPVKIISALCKAEGITYPGRLPPALPPTWSFGQDVDQNTDCSLVFNQVSTRPLNQHIRVDQA